MQEVVERVQNAEVFEVVGNKEDALEELLLARVMLNVRIGEIRNDLEEQSK